MWLEIAEYVRLVKNTRGILLFRKGKEPDSKKLDWIRRVHRYRDVGISPTLWESLNQGKRPFVKLPYPSSDIEEFVKSLDVEIPEFLIETIVISLCYASPIFVLDNFLFSELEKVTAAELRADLLDKTELLRHIRIASYSMIDFYQITKEARNILRKVGIDELCNKRRKFAASDCKKRFWRIEENKEGSIVLAYFDLLHVLKDKIEKVVSNPNLSILLSISCAFSIELG
jgi:hypothetical protein